MREPKTIRLYHNPELEARIRTALSTPSYGSLDVVAAGLSMTVPMLKYWRRKFGLPIFTQEDRRHWIQTTGFEKTHQTRKFQRRRFKKEGVPLTHGYDQGNGRDLVMLNRLRDLANQEEIDRIDTLRKAQTGNVGALILLHEKYLRIRLPLVEQRLSPEVRASLPWIRKAGGGTSHAAA